MTELEAAEEILRGPYSICIYCRGVGQTSHMSPLAVHDQNVFNIISCKKCRGSGKWLRGDYRMACAVLGMECPEVPKPAFNVGIDWDADAAFSASFPSSALDKLTFDSLTHRSLDSWMPQRALPGTIVRIPEEYAESDFLKEP